MKEGQSACVRALPPALPAGSCSTSDAPPASEPMNQHTLLLSPCTTTLPPV